MTEGCISPRRGSTHVSCDRCHCGDRFRLTGSATRRPSATSSCVEAPCSPWLAGVGWGPPSSACPGESRPPCVPTSRTGGSRWSGTKDSATLSKPTVQMVILTPILNRLLYTCRCNCRRVGGLLLLFLKIDVVTFLFDFSFGKRYLQSGRLMLYPPMGCIQWPDSPMEESCDFQGWFFL